MAYLSAEERRARILDAAVEVIADEGLSRATTRRIAERADAPLGALHYCFRNKDELMELVLQRGATTLRDAFEKVDASRGLEATIRASVEAYWLWIRDNLGLTLALTELLMWAIRRGEHGHQLYASVNAPFGGDLLRDNLHRAAEADGITPALPVEELARFIVHRCDGLVFEYAASDDREACQRQADLLADAVVWLALPGRA